MPEILVEYLKKIKKKNSLVCPSKKDKMYTATQWRRAWNSYLYDLDLKYGDNMDRKSKFDKRYKGIWVMISYNLYMKIVFPVGNTDYSSKMTADMVKTATCKDNGSTYQIEIVLLNDKITSPAKGKGYAGVFNTVDGNSIKDANIPGVTFNDISVNGVNGSISCTIDKASGRVTSVTFRNTDKLYIDAKAVSTVKVKLALVSEEKYTIAY